MNKLTNIVTKPENYLWIIFLIFMSCEEWTPQADGYFVIDGKRYNVHIMTIYGDPFPQPSNNNIHVTLQGAPSFNVSMFVTVPSNTLSEGNYHVSDGYVRFGINSIKFFRGNMAEDITSDANSEGDMTVEITGQNYVMEFSGKIKGRVVQIHYAGLVAVLDY